MSIESKSNASGHKHSTLPVFYENTADFLTIPIRGKKKKKKTILLYLPWCS